jgi:ribose 5-phosphate isomerase
MVDSNILKEKVGKEASNLIKDGQVVGLGTGSTTHHFIKFLGQRVENEDLDIMGIPTSFQSLILAREAGIKITTLDEHDIDIAVDGADEVSPNLDLIKGGGAAHTLEKLVDSSADEFVVIVDDSFKSDGGFIHKNYLIPQSSKTNLINPNHIYTLMDNVISFFIVCDIINGLLIYTHV